MSADRVLVVRRCCLDGLVNVDIRVKLPEHAKCVLHGGHLLHMVCWPTGSTYKQVCDVYVAYTLQHYGAQPVVVFDDHGR